LYFLLNYPFGPMFVKLLSQKIIKIFKSYSNYIIVNVFRKLRKLMCRIIYKNEICSHFTILSLVLNLFTL